MKNKLLQHITRHKDEEYETITDLNILYIYIYIIYMFIHIYIYISIYIYIYTSLVICVQDAMHDHNDAPAMQDSFSQHGIQ